MAKSLLSIKHYMLKIKDEKQRKYLASLLASFMRHTKQPPYKEGEELSLPVAYMRLGRTVIMIEFLDEYVKKLMDFASDYIHIRIWPKELHELREHLLEQQRLSREMIRSIIYHEAAKERSSEATSTQAGAIKETL